MTSALLSADLLGFLPNPRLAAQEGRRALCEALAVNCSLLAGEGQYGMIEANLRATVERRGEILSAALRRANKEVVIEVGEHQVHWRHRSDKTSDEDHVYVPIVAGHETWGTVELRFAPLSKRVLFGSLELRSLIFFGFAGSVCLLLFSLFLSKALAQLDPSRVVPPRVRAALDALAEGLLVIDGKDRIVLANRAFADTVGRSAEDLQGQFASKLAWGPHPDHPQLQEFPWREAWRCQDLKQGVPMALKTGGGQERTFIVNAAPIKGDKGKVRGVLASFDDVTTLEAKRLELMGTLQELQDSRKEIQRQNEELQVLATRDPLTSCLNRRAFFDLLETQWNAAQRHGHELSAILIDIDHFKSINDQYGHSVGDTVLRKVGASLRETARDTDVVCRYGGEEFCILLPCIHFDDAYLAAERLREALAAIPIQGFGITASLGVSSLTAGAGDPQELLDQADRALYAAKNAGRNRCMKWTASLDADAEAKPRPSRSESGDTQDGVIPFHAVTGLLSALAFRDAATAAHSSRVAELCVIAARGLMSVSDSYVLEMAALLHDIGKIGVPDSILLKPGPLTEQEWKEMNVHDRIGVEILRSSFASPKLAEIVETHHAFYGGHGRNPSLPTGEEISLGARILAIADAYDAMVSDRVYRKARSSEDAFVELRRCAGTQFDPELVEHFISVIQQRNLSKRTDVQATSKEAALQIGIQIEQIAMALDKQDIEGLASLATHLHGMAAKSSIPQISEVASQLADAASDSAEVDVLIGLTHQLLDLCRATQRAYIDVCTHAHDQPSADRRLVLQQTS